MIDMAAALARLDAMATRYGFPGTSISITLDVSRYRSTGDADATFALYVFTGPKSDAKDIVSVHRAPTLDDAFARLEARLADVAPSPASGLGEAASGDAAGGGRVSAPTVTDLGLEAARELERAVALHAPMHGPHEGYAVILEELDELWDEVRRKKHDPVAMRKECIQIAAMALRFVHDVIDLRCP